MNYLIIENIRSAYNVGNIIRTADAFGRGVVISGYTASPFVDEKVRKSSLGAEKTVPLVTFPATQFATYPALDWVDKQGLALVVAEILPQSVSLYTVDFSEVLLQKKGIALLVGNEVSGVEVSTCARADICVSIPMGGVKASLNVGQASAICMWEITRQSKVQTTL